MLMRQKMWEAPPSSDDLLKSIIQFVSLQLGGKMKCEKAKCKFELIIRQINSFIGMKMQQQTDGTGEGGRRKNCLGTLSSFRAEFKLENVFLLRWTLNSLIFKAQCIIRLNGARLSSPGREFVCVRLRLLWFINYFASLDYQFNQKIVAE